MPLFHPCHKEDLLIGEEGKRGIELLTSVSLSERLDYSWKVLNSTESKYTPQHKEGARIFLCQAFAVPTSDPTVLSDLKKLMALKTPDKIPNFSDLQKGAAKTPEALTTTGAPTINLVPPPTTAIPPSKPMPPFKTPRMTKIRRFDVKNKGHNQRYEQFLEDIKISSNTVNELIEKYNQANSRAEKITLLRSIYQQRKHILNTYSKDDTNVNNEFRQAIERELFSEIKKQAQLIGIPSLRALDQITPEQSASITSPKTLAELIENMEPENAERLGLILSRGMYYSPSDLENLFEPHEQNYKEFSAFLKNNSVCFLGGANSLNFKISPNDGSPPYVLKVENRMSIPKSAEVQLREHALKGILTEDQADRPITFQRPGDHHLNSRRLVVTEFCTGGDLETHGKKISNPEAKIQSAISIYSQMGIILQNMQKAGYGFPDMKNTNWLYDKEGVRIADSKSFLHMNESGNIDMKSSSNRYFYRLGTPYMNPPEFDDPGPLNADNMHAFMMGKNLYQYLTSCDFSYLHSKDSTSLDFSAAIFQTAEGRQLQELIQQLTRPYPEDRISLQDGLIKLNQMKSNKKGCYEILDALEQVKADTKDLASRLVLADSPENIEEVKKALLHAQAQTVDKMYHEQSEAIQKLGITIEPGKIDALKNASSIGAALEAKQAIYLAVCDELMNQLKALSFGENDEDMNTYISAMEYDINSRAHKRETLPVVINELTNILRKLNQNKESINALKTVISDLKGKSGGEAKIKRIEQAMNDIPIRERNQLATPNTPEKLKLHRELASHRHFWRKHPQVVAGLINEKTAAKSFFSFKNALEKNKEAVAAKKEDKKDAEEKDNRPKI